MAAEPHVTEAERAGPARHAALREEATRLALGAEAATADIVARFPPPQRRPRRRPAASFEPEGSKSQRYKQWCARARELRKDRRHEEARVAAERALTYRPRGREALWLALQSAAQLVRPADFEALSRRLAGAGTAKVEDLRRLAPLALRAGAVTHAEALGQRLLARDAADPVGIEVVATARWELGDEVDARDRLAAAERSSDPDVLRAALGIRVRLDDLDGAPDALERIEPPDVRLLVDFARRFVTRGEPAPAQRLLARIAAANPDEPRLEELQVAAGALSRLHSGEWARRVGPPSAAVEPRAGRALHLVSASLPHHTSGGTYRTHFTARALNERGLPADVATQLGFGAEDAGGLSDVEGVAYHRVLDPRPEDAATDARLARNLEGLSGLVERLRPAVLHPHSDHRNAMLALELRERYGIPVVYEVRGFPEERLVPRPWSRVLADQSVGRRALELRCMLAADRIVTLAEVMKAHMVERGVPAEKITVIPNGVDVERLVPEPRDDALAARLGIADGEVTLGYVSTFHGYEGIRYIVEATAELRRRGHAVKALLVGDGNERDALARLAESLGIADAVILTGRVPHEEVTRYYGLIDVFVVPRRREATSELVTPLKPFEAMALGRPLVVSDVAALREVVDDGRHARLFEPDNPMALADVAETLIGAPDERRAQAAAAREWVAAERTWARNGDRYRALYDGLGVL